MEAATRKRTVLVTGASSGIGEAVARVLAERGDTVALVARRADRLDAVLADCRITSPHSARWAADLSDPAAAAELALSVWDHYDGLDVVINNAGVPMRRHATKLTMAEVERTMRTNYFSPVAITVALLPRMLARGSGTFVNVSSVGGRLGIATEAAYSGSKFALAGWSEALAMDLAGSGVSVKLILPGAIDTEIWDQPDNDAPIYDGPKDPPSGIARGIVDALDSEAFEHYLPDMKAVIEMKTSDIDGFMRGMAAMTDQAMGRDPRMKALLFGAAPDPSEIRPTPHDELETMLAGLPFGLHEIDDARVVRPDWVITKPILSGVCGSDAKLVLGDFSSGDIDNPMAAFSSLPHVPGHEVVAEVVALGPQATGLEVGQRVVLNPWLTCGPRGIEPPCPPCAAGDLSLCWSFTKGDLGPGVHVGVITGAPGAWAERLAAHDSMLIPVPDGISNEAAVLADPFSVSLHAILRNPPPPSGRVLVYGAGALGLTSVAALRLLHPDVEVAVVARFEAQHDMALRFGASKVFAHEPRLALVEALAEWSGAVLHNALDGLPVTHPGHIDVVYDTIAKGETLEVGVRVLAERGRLVYTGVSTPQRWESTPIYFKELVVTGSNAFGHEDLDGLRQHAIADYLRLVAEGRLDITPMLTHRFALTDWWDALKAIARQDESGALKVAFTPNG